MQEGIDDLEGRIHPFFLEVVKDLDDAISIQKLSNGNYYYILKTENELLRGKIQILK